MCKALSFRITGKKYNSSPRVKALAWEACTEKMKATVLQKPADACHLLPPERYRGAGLGQTCLATVLGCQGCDSRSTAPRHLNGWNGVNGSDQPEVQRAACEKIAFSFQHAKETAEKLLFSFFSSTRQSR